MHQKNKFPRSWVEISKRNLLHNLKEFRKIVGSITIAYVVKANAYGHGLKEVVSILKKEKNIWFAVDNLNEALVLRSIDKDIPVLILGYTPIGQLRKTINNNISLTVYNLETLVKISKLKLSRKARIHIKVETGLNRQGVKIKDILNLVSFIKKNNKYFFLEGTSTHFASIGDSSKPDFALKQLYNFKKAINLIEKEGFKIPFKHCAATAATILNPQTYFNMVRIGIGLYGLWPSQEVRSLKNVSIELKPVLTWKSSVAQVKEIQKGESVSYGRTWLAQRKSKIAIISVGYFDGFDRKLSNCGRVLIGGKFANVLGRVTMNMIMVDVTEHRSIVPEDEVIIIGRMGKREITSVELAERIGTINYEIVARINTSLPRIIV